MKREKQELVMEILRNGKYRVDANGGIVYSFRKGDGEWKALSCSITRSGKYLGYRQHQLHLGRGKGKKAIVYAHVLVWMSVHGMYEEGKVINHKDLDKMNCSIHNLELVSCKENVEHALKNVKYKDTGEHRAIRHNEISQIKKMLGRGIKNHSRIARELGLGRLAVRYTIKNIESGKELKYEMKSTI